MDPCQQWKTKGCQKLKDWGNGGWIAWAWTLGRITTQKVRPRQGIRANHQTWSEEESIKNKKADSFV